MNEAIDPEPTTRASGTVHHRVRPVAAGLALSVFFVVTFLLAALFYSALPDAAGTRAVFNELLPGVNELSLGFLVLGALVAIGLAWYIALVMVPIYNYFVARG